MQAITLFTQAISQHHPASWWLAFVVGMVAGSLLVGVLLGLIPLILGRYLGQTRLGQLGFLISVVAGFIAGILGALPVAVGFAGTIFVRWRRSRNAIVSPAEVIKP
jgi:fructose-specific phosphotransferase system IIC component